MKIATVTMVRHDGDVIEEFVRHTARFVDQLYIYNNVALDASAEILAALQGEGLPLILRDVDQMIIHDWHWNNVLRQVWSETDADYLISIDADEFLIAESRAILERELAELPPGAHGILPWVTYVPLPGDDLDEPRTLARIQHHLAREHVQWHKIAMARTFVEQSAVSSVIGAHAVKGADNFQLRTVRLAHFPVRSLAQVKAKALLGWSSFLALGYGEKEGLGYQWQRLYLELLKNPNWTETEFYYFGRTYLGISTEGTTPVREPLPPVERRYVRPDQDLFTIALAFTQQLAKAVGYLINETRRLHAEVAKRPPPDDHDQAAAVARIITENRRLQAELEAARRGSP